MVEYIFKTDRSGQWNSYVESWDVTRKVVKEAKVYFDGGVLSSSNDYGLHQLLFLQPNQSLAGWQNVLNTVFQFDSAEWAERKRGNALDNLFEYLQQSFLGYISNHFYHSEDRAWIFKLIFGETYDSERLFPLVLPTETEKRKVSFDANEILSCLFVDFSKFYRNKIDSSYAAFLISYIESAIPFLTISDVFRVDESLNEGCDVIRRNLHKIILWANRNIDSADDNEKPKIELARQVKAIFDNYDGELGDYKKLVELIEKEGSQV